MKMLSFGTKLNEGLDLQVSEKTENLANYNSNYLKYLKLADICHNLAASVFDKYGTV